MCLRKFNHIQEVDRLDTLIPLLDSANYSHTYASGPRKKHGCLIAYRTALYEKTGQTTIHYDDTYVRSEGTDVFRRGGSFRTKNIGLVVALKRTGAVDERVVIATTHLFWHPRYSLSILSIYATLIQDADILTNEFGPCYFYILLAVDLTCSTGKRVFSLVR